MTNWDSVLQGKTASGTASGDASDVAFNVEQARAQRFADMQFEAANPAIAHAAPVLGEFNIPVTGVGSADGAVAPFVRNAGTAAGTANAIGSWPDMPFGWCEGCVTTARKGNAIMAETLDPVRVSMDWPRHSWGLGRVTPSPVPTQS